MNKYLIIQTAFLGDVVLSLPMAEYIKKKEPDSYVVFVTIPATMPVAEACPFVDEVVVYDKRGNDKGIWGIFRLAKALSEYGFKAIFSPHKPLRSRILTLLTKSELSYGFRKRTRNLFYTNKVPYIRSNHAIIRNLSLVRAHWNDSAKSIILPTFDVESHDTETISLAPGSVWKTKQMPAEKWIELILHPYLRDKPLQLIGGKDDAEIADQILNAVEDVHGNIENRVGKDRLKESFQRIADSNLLVSNDSAPQHFAMAVRTPVITIFGSTIKEFGFYPVGKHDKIVETHLDLECRPCGAHGKMECPTGTFACMKSIDVEEIVESIKDILF